MIRLAKVSEPAILVDNSADWLEALTDKIASGKVILAVEKSRYRHRDIKSALIEETHGKCAYCETKFLHTDFGDIEHIVPKSLHIDKTFEWSNLTLACGKCNTSKGDEEFIVNPYVDDPATYFNFIGPMICGISSDLKAINTERRLQLNRAELVERRSARLKAISDQLILIAQAQNDAIRDTLERDLVLNEMQDHSEFSAFVRSFVNTLRQLENSA